MPTELKGRDAVAQAIYEALGYEYAGKLIDIKGQPMGAWRDALSAADVAILAYEAAKPKEAPRRPSSRADIVVRLRHREAGYRISGPRYMAEMLDDAASEIESARAMLSAAGER